MPRPDSATLPLLPSLFRARRSLLRDLLGGAVILTVWLFLWSWFVLALSTGTPRPSFAPPPAAAMVERA